MKGYITKLLSEFDSNFKITKMNILENRLSDEQYGDITLNQNFTYTEFISAVKKLKTGKATGLDNIPNEVLKINSLHEPLLLFYNMCFRRRCSPTDWNCAIINPIPQSSTKDPYVPLNYRGLSLIYNLQTFHIDD